jgi:hypothetical protein
MKFKDEEGLYQETRQFDVGLPEPKYVLDPNYPFEAILIEMLLTHRKKRKDYASDADPHRNFRDCAEQLGLTAGHSVELHLATKQARLKTLLPKYWADGNATAANEPIEDTFLDRAVYSVIALVMWREGAYDAHH